VLQLDVGASKTAGNVVPERRAARGIRDGGPAFAGVILLKTHAFLGFSQVRQNSRA
jgi:hypothetical protein